MSCLTRSFVEDAHNEGFGKNRAVGEVALKPLTARQCAKPAGAWRGERWDHLEMETHLHNWGGSRE